MTVLHALLFAALMGGSSQLHVSDAPAQDREPVVHVIIFYSPTCPHCEMVITDHLLPMKDRYGDRLAILAFDTSNKLGVTLFRAALEHYAIPREGWVVPFMIVGDEIMTGSVDIPSRLPGMVEKALAEEGIDLPDFPALISFLDDQGALITLEPGPRYLYQSPAAMAANPEQPEPPPDSMAPERHATAAEETLVDTARVVDAPSASQPLTNPTEDVASAAADTATRVDVGAVATAGPETETHVTPEGVPDAEPDTAPEDSATTKSRGTLPPPSVSLELTEMLDPAAATPWTRFGRDRAGNSLALVVLAALVLVLGSAFRLRSRRRVVWPEWATPGLATVGLAVALYLSYVEVTGNPATCGPVGDCNTVQQSPYATLFGILPVGILGSVGYVVILALWLARNVAATKARRIAAMTLWALTLVGTLFSIYLTFLEPFVIGATCMWCLTSAAVMALLLLASVGPASRALATREVQPEASRRASH